MRKSNAGDFPDAKIAVVDDDEPTLKFAQQILQVAGYTDVKLIQDPRLAVDVIAGEGADLVFLDVRMPHMDGYEVLERLIRKLGPDTFVPILMCTSDNSQEARQRALKLGANDFITKPYDQTEMVLRVRNFLRMRSMHLSIVEAKATLENRVRIRTRELVESQTETLDCLTRALGSREDSDRSQAARLTNLCERIARGMGIEEAEVEMIGMIAPLHDLGKLALPYSLLLKLEQVPEEGLPEMQRHTVLGEAIIGNCSWPLLREVRELALHHHEKWDGSGYPHGLAGEQIPMPCRIVSLAIHFDSITNPRSGRPPLTRAEAVNEIRKLRGSHFDPDVVDAFLKLHAA